MTRKLRAGIIGLGVGETHIAGYEAHPMCEVAKLCDADPQKRAEISRRYPNLRFAETAEELIDDPEIDVLSVASYDSDHYEQIVRAIRKGKHLFVEKPLCLNEKDAEHILQEIANHPNIILSSNLILRSYPRLERIRKMIDNQAFGKIYLMEGDYNYGRLEKITKGWRGKINDYSVTLGGGIHMIDLLLWLCRKKVTSVFAVGNQISTEGTGIPFNDMVASLLTFVDGSIGKIAVNFGSVYPHFHRISLYGTEATFVNEPTGGWIYRSRDPGVTPEQMTESYPGAKKGDLIYQFIDAIVGNGSPAVTIDEIFEALAVAFAIDRSVKSGKSERVRSFSESRR